jgi:hypothetical protein
MKVGESENMKNQNPSYILGYLLELINKNLANLGHLFFMENPLYRLKSYFAGRNLARSRQRKKTYWR